MRNNARIARWRTLKNRTIAREAKQRPCLDCGEYRPPMVFHHRDPSTKLFAPVTSNTKSERVLRAEIAKCDVLCQRCHHQRHWEMRDAHLR